MKNEKEKMLKQIITKPMHSSIIINTQSLPKNSLFELSQIDDKSLLQPTKNVFADFYLGYQQIEGIGSVKECYLSLVDSNSNMKVSVLKRILPIDIKQKEIDFVADIQTRLLFKTNPILRQVQKLLVRAVLLKFGIEIDQNNNVTALVPSTIRNQAWVKASNVQELKEASVLQHIVKSLYLLDNTELAQNLLQFMLDINYQIYPRKNLSGLANLLDDLPVLPR